MKPSSRTPEGEPNRCPICKHDVVIEPSLPAGDATCSFCGHLLWFPTPPTRPTPQQTRPTPQQITIAAECWRRANEAISQENWDFAIQMYGYSVKMVPENLTYRQSLRFTEYKKYEMNMKGARMSDVKLKSPRERIKRCRVNKDWKGVGEAAEDGLTVNPWDSNLSADLGDALKELGYQEVAVFAYEESLKVDPGNVAVNRSLAFLYEGRSQYDAAVNCWQRILKIEPTDSEAHSKIASLKGPDR